jgi:hypothetical protein
MSPLGQLSNLAWFSDDEPTSYWSQWSGFTHQAVPVEAKNLLFRWYFSVNYVIYLLISPPLEIIQKFNFQIIRRFRKFRVNLWHVCRWVREVIFCPQYFASYVTKVKLMATGLNLNLEPGRIMQRTSFIDQQFLPLFGSLFVYLKTT